MSGKHHRKLSAADRRALDRRREEGTRGAELEGRDEFVRMDRYVAALRAEVRLLTAQRDGSRRDAQAILAAIRDAHVYHRCPAATGGLPCPLCRVMTPRSEKSATLKAHAEGSRGEAPGPAQAAR